jgi:putative DNA primase/helicase
MNDQPPLIPIPVEDPLKLAWFELNDFGNARRLEALAKGLLKWVDEKYWVAFDGKRWSEREGTYRARALAHDVAQHIHDEAAALGELIGSVEKPNEAKLKERFGEWCTGERALDRLKALHGHAVKSGNAAQTAAMLTQAKGIVTMRAWTEDFDQDPLTYNVRNGTLRFRQDEAGRWGVRFQRGHEPADMLMALADVDYDPDARCPMWEQRFEDLQPDAEVRAVLPRKYGQTLTGLTDSEEFYVEKGRGGDGKSKTHEVLAELHGDYYRHAGIKTWLQASFQKSGAEHRADMVELAGDVRFIVSEEPPPRATWDGELLKQFTGGGKITARGSGAAKPITFKPRGKLFVEINPTPKMPGDDKGFRRRFRLTLWLVDISKLPGGEEPPAILHARLMTEASGILNWLIAGCLEWLGDRKVPVPERESEALADFWATGNPLGEWLAEECDLSDRDAETGATVLHQSFKDWMDRNEIEEDTKKNWTQTKFGRELGQRQIIGKKDRRGNIVRRGIKLRAADPLLQQGQGGPAGRPDDAPPKAAARDFGSADPLGDDDGVAF